MIAGAIKSNFNNKKKKMAKKVQQIFIKTKPHCILVLLDM